MSKKLEESLVELDESLIQSESQNLIKKVAVEQLSELFKLIFQVCDFIVALKLKLLTIKDELRKTSLSNAVCTNSVEFLQKYFYVVESIPVIELSKIFLSNNSSIIFATASWKTELFQVVKLLIDTATRNLSVENLKF